MDLEPIPMPSAEAADDAHAAASGGTRLGRLRTLSRRAKVIVTVGLAVAMAAAGFGIGQAVGGHGPSSIQASNAAAAPGPQTPGRPAFFGPGSLVAGQVVARKGSSFTVQERSTAVKVATASTTTFTKVAIVPVAAVTPNMMVVAVGTRAAPGAAMIAARDILIVPASPTRGLGGLFLPFLGRRLRGFLPPMAGPSTAPASHPALVFGTVQKNATGTITMTSRAGQTVTVTTNPATKVLKTAAASLGDIGTKAFVLARGTRATDGSLSAKQVFVVPAAVASSLPAVGGFGRHGPARLRPGA